MMRFAEQAARFYESVEVIELHHPDKVDAPSGTAARTAWLIGAARKTAAWSGARRHHPRPRGARCPRGRHTSTRQRGPGPPGGAVWGCRERWHDPHSFDRASFMPGVLEGIRRGEHPGLTVGLEHYLAAGHVVREKVTALVLLVVLGFYSATIGWRGVELIRDGRPAAVPVGIGVILLPLVLLAALLPLGGWPATAPTMAPTAQPRSGRSTRAGAQSWRSPRAARRPGPPGGAAALPRGVPLAVSSTTEPGGSPVRISLVVAVTSSRAGAGMVPRRTLLTARAANPGCSARGFQRAARSQPRGPRPPSPGRARRGARSSRRSAPATGLG